MSQGPDQPDAAPASPPLLTVVRGEPTATEIAAVTVIVGALASRASLRPAAGRPRASLWAAKDHALRPQLRAGRDAWKASALPR